MPERTGLARLDQRDVLGAPCHAGRHARCTGRLVNPDLAARPIGSRDIEMACVCPCHTQGSDS